MQPNQQKPVIPTNESIIEGHVLVPEHVRQVVDLVGVGRDAENVAIGFHGTSLASLIVAMKTGFIPTGRSQNCEGHLFFFPTSHAEVNREGLIPLTNDTQKIDSKSFEEASGYAHDLSRAVLAAKALDLNLSSDVGWRTAINLSDIATGQDISGREALKDAGFSERELILLDRQLDRVKRGFVLLINPSALTEHAHHLGDPGYGDLKIELPPEGLSLKHLVGIEPLSEEDLDIIETLDERSP
jgi:hypothetical protein